MLLDGGIVFFIVLAVGIIAYLKGIAERRQDANKHEPTKDDIEAFKSWYRSHKRDNNP